MNEKKALSFLKEKRKELDNLNDIEKKELFKKVNRFCDEIEAEGYKYNYTKFDTIKNYAIVDNNDEYSIKFKNKFNTIDYDNKYNKNISIFEAA